MALDSLTFNINQSKEDSHSDHKTVFYPQKQCSAYRPSIFIASEVKAFSESLYVCLLDLNNQDLNSHVTQEETGDVGLISVWGRPPCRRAWQSTAVFLPGEPHGQRSLVGSDPQSQSRTRPNQLSMQHACMQELVLKLLFWKMATREQDFFMPDCLLQKAEPQ